MKSKTFLTLILVLCIVGAAAYFVTDSRKPDRRDSLMGQKLFKELPVKDIEAIRIAGHENGALQSVDLKKTDSGWGVENRFGYPARFQSISELVEKATDSKIGRSFEGSPETFARLGLNPPDAAEADADSKGLRISFLAGGDKPLADLIVGKQRESSAGSGGHYLRPADSNAVYLVDQSWQFIEKRPENWIETDLLDVKADRVRSVDCVSSADESLVYEASRPEKGQAPELKDPDEGKKLKPRSVNALFDVLSSLRIQDVAGPASEVPDAKTGFDSGSRLDYRLFDGTIYRLYPGKKADGDDNGKDGFYLKVEVAYQEPEKNNEESVGGDPAEDAAEPSGTQGDEDASAKVENADDQAEKAENPEPADRVDPGELAIEARNLNEKYAGWVYIVSDWEHKSMITDPAEFYEEEQKEDAEKAE